MSSFDETSPRRVVPRWRDSTTLAAMAEALPIAAQVRVYTKTSPADQLALLRADWEQNRHIAYAADLVGSAFLLNEHELAKDAAGFLLKRPHEVPLGILSIAQRVAGLGPKSGRTEIKPRDSIRAARAELRNQIQNPLLLMDTARFFCILGNNDKARQFMRIALYFAPNHRSILRAASRLYVHLNEPDVAHSLLARPAATNKDPWLLAAEISVATVAGRSSRLVNRAESILDSGIFDPMHTTELASAIATLELSAGKHKLAKKLFVKALVSPNDNSVAQAEWAARLARLDLGVEEAIRKVPDTFEADFWVNYQNRDVRLAKESALSWIQDEPFSTRPAIMGTFLAGIDGDYYAATAIGKIGLQANPHDAQLLNNLVFAQASTDRVEEAWRTISSNIDYGSAHCLANIGLIAYRSHDIDKGRRFYELAQENSRRTKQSQSEILATAYHAREAVLAGDPLSSEVYIRAEQLLKNQPSVGVRIAWEAIQRELKDISKRQPLTANKAIPELTSTLQSAEGFRRQQQ